MTIFSSPRPFKGKFDLIQRNAIQSWLTALPDCEIILVGDEEGTEKVAGDFGLRHISEAKKNKEGVILRNSVFEEAQKVAQYDLLCYINADILLTGNFLKEIKTINLPSFLLSVRRWDMDVKEEINFTDHGWQKSLLEKMKQEGILHGFSAGDFFIFSKNVRLNMPPFSIKHGGWDNCFIYRFKKLGIPIIDATEVITVIHQNHEKTSLGITRSIWREKEGKEEIRLAGGFYSMCTLREADLVLTAEGLKKPPFLRQILSRLALFYPWQLLLSLKRRLLS